MAAAPVAADPVAAAPVAADPVAAAPVASVLWLRLLLIFYWKFFFLAILIDVALFVYWWTDSFNTSIVQYTKTEDR